MYCIYRITNCINGKTYIGQHKYKNTPYDSYMGSGKILKQAQVKYGIENFIKGIIIDSIEDREVINQLERDYIVLERQYNHNGCYNITDGGEGGCGPHSEEWKRKVSKKLKGRPIWIKGKHHTEEQKRKVSEKLKGIKREPITEEHRKHLVESHKGKRQSEETKRKRSEALKGRPRSEETKRKISERMKAVKASQHLLYRLGLECHL